MTIRGIIFDWAGTTVDYGCMAPVNAFYQAFKEKEIILTNEEIRGPMGLLKKDHIRSLLSLERVKREWKERYSREFVETDVEELYQKFEAVLFEQLAEYSEVKPGVLEMVAELRTAGIKIGSTTGYTKEMMEVVVKTAEKQGYQPDVVITPTDVSNMGRPFPYMVFANMEKLQLASVHEVLKVGDTISDIQEGKAAGVRTVGILEGSSLAGLSKQEFEQLSLEEQKQLNDRVRTMYFEAGADFTISTISELPQLVNAL